MQSIRSTRVTPTVMAATMAFRSLRKRHRPTRTPSLSRGLPLGQSDPVVARFLSEPGRAANISENVVVLQFLLDGR
jgi:hypothetical protein